MPRMRRSSRRRGGGLTRAMVAKMVRFPRDKYAKVYLPRDGAERARVAAALAVPGALTRPPPFWDAGANARSDLRRMTGYTGRGDYQIASGNNFSIFGTAMGGGAAMYGGRGDYSVKNSLVGDGVSSAGIPTFGPHHAEYTVTKTEFLQSIYAPAVAGQFQNTVLTIQPGLQETFPWLGLIAPNFEEYELKQLMFYYRPMVTDFNSGTGQCGEIIMVTQYNPSDTPFTDTLRAKSYDGAMSSKTSVPMTHGVECDPSLNSGAPGKYIRVGPLDADQDLKQYDMGNLNVIVNDTPAGYNNQLLGEIWCAYTVCLRKPRLPQSTGDTILRDYFEGLTAPTNSSPSYWTPQTILSGQQNRIGTVIKPVATDTTVARPGWRIEFPNWYTGDVRVTVVLQSITFAAGTNDFQVIGYPGTNSNVVQISDTLTLIGASGQLYGQSPAPQFVDTIINGVAMCMLVFDFRVGSNINGNKNYAYIAPRTGLELRTWSIDISEYNTSFNSPTTGHPLLNDYMGNPVSN